MAETIIVTATVVIDMLGGNCPVQAEGTVNGIPFYFRARGQRWTFGVGEDPVGISAGQAGGFHHEEAWGAEQYDAGWMPEDEARAFIVKGAALFASHQGVTPRATTTQPPASGDAEVASEVRQPIREGLKSAVSLPLRRQEGRRREQATRPAQ